MSKKHLPIAITERHIKFWLVDHTGWILRDWDGSCEQMRNAIDDGAYQGKPYMLYAGNREYRHRLHKKLGSNFSHASVNLDDGSRVMIIVNNPGYIYTYNDHAVCFFEYSSNFYSRKVAATAAALEQQVRSALDKMHPRGVAEFLPQQQYESKSAADERKDAAQTINKWRENANKMIGHTEPESEEEYEQRVSEVSRKLLNEFTLKRFAGNTKLMDTFCKEHLNTIPDSIRERLLHILKSE